MPMDGAAHRSARDFVLRGVAWSLCLFGLMRLGWIESHAILPLTAAQGRLARGLFGAAALPVEVTLACSGADALALCAAAILAYPAAWRRRLQGAAGGILLILALNTIRIGTLGRAAGSPYWFDILHLYAWPAVLALAVAGYVFGWMHAANSADASPAAVRPSRRARRFERRGITTRFVLLTALCVVLFSIAVPLYGDSAGVLAAAGLAARLAAGSLALVGVAATATGNVLSTSRGAFVVTQECLTTPLIPVYVATALGYAGTWKLRAAALAAALPLFIALGALRLLVVALPATIVASPLFLIHAFYQLLLAAVVVTAAALWRHGRSANAVRRAVAGMALGGAFVYLFGFSYGEAIAATAGASPALPDPQGALALLPGFQIGLYFALCVVLFAIDCWAVVAAGTAVLALTQIAVFEGLGIAARAVVFAPQVREVRAWAVTAPVLVVAAMMTYARARR